MESEQPDPGTMELDEIKLVARSDTGFSRAARRHVAGARFFARDFDHNRHSVLLQAQTASQEGKKSINEAIGDAMVEDIMSVADDSADRALFLGVLDLSTEDKVLQLLDHLLSKNPNANAGHEYGLLPIHVAAFRGYARVIEVLIQELKAMVDKTDKGGWLPINYALIPDEEHDDAAAVLLRNMSHKRVREHFEFIPDMTGGVTYSLTEYQQKQTMPKTVRAVLDCTIDSPIDQFLEGRRGVLERQQTQNQDTPHDLMRHLPPYKELVEERRRGLLRADEQNVHIPNIMRFLRGSNISHPVNPFYDFHSHILNSDSSGRLPQEDDFTPKLSFLQAVTNTKDKEVVYHLAVRRMMKRKIRLAQLVYGFSAAFFTVFLVLLTIVFVAAADQPNPNDYSSSHGRIVLEILCLCYVFYSTAKELMQLVWNAHSTNPQARNPSEQGYQPNATVEPTRCKRLKQWALSEPYLPLKVVSFSLLWLYLPFRVANAQGQWYVGALAYLVTFLIVFKYTDIVRPFGHYTQTVRAVFMHDVFQFFFLFVIFLLAFAGALFMSLRGENGSVCANDPIPDQNATSDHNVTCAYVSNIELFPDFRSYKQVLLTTVRQLVEQDSVIDYYGDKKKFGWLSMVLLMVFLILILLLLLNLLIAQLSDTYQNITNDKVREVQLNRASVICRFERSLWFRFFRYLHKSDFQRIDFIAATLKNYFEDCQRVLNPLEDLQEWETPPVRRVEEQLEIVLSRLTVLESQNKSLKRRLSSIQENLCTTNAARPNPASGGTT